jgi:hypothetical protein
MEKGGSVSTHEVRIWELVEQAARAATDEDGRFSGKRHKDELAHLLSTVDFPQVRDVQLDLSARKLVESFARRRNPRTRNGQSAIPSLYDDGFLLVLEDGMRVWMEDATQQDLILWGNRTAEKTAKHLEAQRQREQYIEARLTVWRGRPDIEKLGKLERHFFGYSPVDGDGMDDDLDGDDVL